MIRPSLAAETLAELRRRIEAGAFGERMPGERQLCEDLGVSRPTMRAALEELEREGSIASDGRKARRVLARPKRRDPSGKGAERVVLLRSAAANARAADPSLDYFLGHEFHLAGYEFLVRTVPSEVLETPGVGLRNLVHSLRPSLWILTGLPRKAQRWFLEQNARCLVFGSSHAEAGFPFLDEDYRATCRHAAGRMLAAGHRQLALLLPKPMLQGDRESREGFLEGLKLSQREGLGSTVVQTGGTPESAARAAKKLLAAEPRPTAWLVCHPHDCVSVLTYLLGNGVSIPGDVSLVCRTSRTALKHVWPKLARYERDHARFRKKLLQMALHLLREGMLATRQNRIGSGYVPGESLGAGPEKDD